MKLRRLEAADAPAFQRLRIEGFALQPREFRYAPEDEANMPLAEVAARLARDFVVGVFDDDTLVGIAGLTRLRGAKTSHKALLWGMYLRAEFRGRGGADMLMSAILDFARGRLAARGGITALLFNRYCSSPIIKTPEVIYVPRTSDTSCHPR